LTSAGSSVARILVADDDAQLCASLKLLLSAHDYDVATAHTGRECLDAIRGHQPDVLVLDLAMPELDGFGVLRALDGLQLDSQPPDVIVLTGRGGISDGARAIREGAVGFLTKPARNVELLTLISRAIAGREAVYQTRRLSVESRKHWECSLSCRRDSIRSVVNHLAAEMRLSGLVPPGVMRRVVMAADEAITNAVIHGGLEIGSALKERMDPGAFEQACTERERDESYGERKIHVSVDTEPGLVTITVHGPGPGFDTSSLPDPNDGEALLRTSGRGLIIMGSLVDEVSFDDEGRRVVLRQRL
jgi:CheY-like chemotaxis protein